MAQVSGAAPPSYSGFDLYGAGGAALNVGNALTETTAEKTAGTTVPKQDGKAGVGVLVALLLFMAAVRVLYEISDRATG